MVWRKKKQFTWKHTDDHDLCGIAEDPGEEVDSGGSLKQMYSDWDEKGQKMDKE